MSTKFAWAVCLNIWPGVGTALADQPRKPVDFNRDVRPIFQRRCIACHGGVKQASGLSFLYRHQVTSETDSGAVPVIPGKPNDSELISRIASPDDNERMPPDDHGPPLSADQIDLLRRWIAEGAPWESHWAYANPEKQPLPKVAGEPWCRNRIDYFVLARLEREGLAPAPEPSPAQLLRRVSLDLTGLPPSPKDVAEFLADPSEGAYERQVDRLLDDVGFGERWTAMWLDLARYADTMGYEKDLHRNIWPYRDYVIDAFNADKPFDRFTIEQLAGDLLPQPTAEQLVATAFHRNTQNNTEGGTDDEEFRVAAVIDRVNTTWQVWQGQTFNCAQCHHHPYDPFTQEEFYRFLTIFNSTEDADLPNEFPRLAWPRHVEDRQTAVQLDHDVRRLRRSLNDAGRNLADEVADWTPLHPKVAESTHGELKVATDGEIRAAGTLAVQTSFTLTMPAVPFTAIRIDVTPEADDPAQLPERGSVLSHWNAELVPADGEPQPIAFHEVFADTLAGPYDPMDSLKESSAGFGGYPKLNAKRWAVFVPQEPIQPAQHHQLRIVINHRAAVAGSQAVTLRRFRLSSSKDPRWTECVNQEKRIAAWEELRDQQKKRDRIDSVSIPVMIERPTEARRETRVFVRGNFLDKAQGVEPGVPGSMPPLPEKTKGDRLALAQWLVSPENPLTARVMVNRLWAELFGIGIVETLEDFGSAGQPPSHPALLDDLAVQFRTEDAWSVKQLLRRIVTSATYRQDPSVTPELVKRDPRNRLLARGPRTRLTAEMIRDQALAVSGLLSHKVGGRSVKPYQPEGVWQTIYNFSTWKVSEGEDRYRRGVYTYWRRTSPYPSAVMFDSPSREICTGRRMATNTPLQALVTLNDPAYVECAQALARRARAEHDDDVGATVRCMLELATAGAGTGPNVDHLAGLYEAAKTKYQANPDAIGELAESAEEAALVLVANAILNLDMVLMK